MQLVSLRCEFLNNPLGIDVLAPRLSWQLRDDRRGACQRAYQLQAAPSAEALAQGKADLWDSGRVESVQSHLVPYAGPALRSGQWVYWRVRVWDQEDQPSAWSEPAELSSNKSCSQMPSPAHPLPAPVALGATRPRAGRGPRVIQATTSTIAARPPRLRRAA